MEVDARLLPLALHGSLADIPGSRDFREGKSAKILQVNNLREGWFGLGEFVERLTDANEVAVVNRVLDFGSERGDLEQRSHQGLRRGGRQWKLWRWRRLGRRWCGLRRRGHVTGRADR
jgi:hypothetical protein